MRFLGGGIGHRLSPKVQDSEPVEDSWEDIPDGKFSRLSCKPRKVLIWM